MTVYVDDARHPYGRMIMCHMWADDIAELMAMADRIGVSRRWLQQPPKARWVHFDVSLGMKEKAIAAGAVLTDRYGPVEHTAQIMIASGNPELVSYGEKKLTQIARLRALKLSTPERQLIAHAMSESDGSAPPDAAEPREDSPAPSPTPGVAP